MARPYIQGNNSRCPPPACEWNCPLTFLACCRCVFVRRLLFLLLAAQVTCVDRHGGFDLLLGKLHTLVEHLEELLGLVVTRQTYEK